MCLRFSSSTGYCRFQLLHRDRYTQCKLQETGVPQCSSWVVVDMPGVYNDKSSAENCGGSAVAVGAVLGMVLTCPLLYYNRCLVVQTVQKTLEVPQLHFIDVGSCRWNLQLPVPAVFSAV